MVYKHIDIKIQILVFILACSQMNLVIAGNSIPSCNKKNFVIGIEDIYYYPYYAKVNNSEPIGAIFVILNKFAKEQGYKFNYEFMPVKRLLYSLQYNEIDFKFPANEKWKTKTKQSMSKIVYSSGILGFTDGGFTLVGNSPDLSSASNNLYLGTVRGFTPWIYLEHINSGRVTLDENNSFINLIRKGLLKRVDIVYGNVAVIKHISTIKLNANDMLTFDATLPFSSDNYKLATINCEGVITKLNKWLVDNSDYISALSDELGAKAVAVE